MRPEPVARAERLLGGEAEWWAPAGNRIGAANQERFRLRLADGRTAFAKAATSEESAGWIRAEHLVYEAVDASFMPRLLCFESGDRPLLLLEDLGAAHWPPPWTDEAVAAARHALAMLAATRAPAGLPALADDARLRDGWEQVAAGPEPFLALGLCSRAWLEAALPALERAAGEAPLAGDALVTSTSAATTSASATAARCSSTGARRPRAIRSSTRSRSHRASRWRAGRRRGSSSPREPRRSSSR